MFWVLLAFVVIILFVVAVLKFKGAPSTKDFPYIKNKPLFSPAERSFLGVLEQALGADYQIFGKVRVADIISVQPMADRSAWQRAFNRISAKHFDFVLCTKNELTVVAAIELDDQSHQRPSRQKRDSFLLRVCQVANLPLLQFPVQRTYSIMEIRNQVLAVLGSQQKPDSSLLSPPSPLKAPKIETQTLRPDSKTQGPSCPKCSAPMVLRVAKTGAHAGQKFWGCSTFPKCRAFISHQSKDQ